MSPRVPIATLPLPLQVGERSARFPDQGGGASGSVDKHGCCGVGCRGSAQALCRALPVCRAIDSPCPPHSAYIPTSSLCTCVDRLASHRPRPLWHCPAICGLAPPSAYSAPRIQCSPPCSSNSRDPRPDRRCAGSPHHGNEQDRQFPLEDSVERRTRPTLTAAPSAYPPAAPLAPATALQRPA